MSVDFEPRALIIELPATSIPSSLYFSLRFRVFAESIGAVFTQPSLEVLLQDRPARLLFC